MVFGITNILLTKIEKWNSISHKLRSQMATILLDIIDQVTFDDYTENFINSDLYYYEHDEIRNPYMDFTVNKENLGIILKNLFQLKLKNVLHYLLVFLSINSSC